MNWAVYNLTIFSYLYLSSVYNLAAVSFKKSKGLGSSKSDWIDKIILQGSPIGGDHFSFKISTETKPSISLILGWNIFVINLTNI